MRAPLYLLSFPLLIGLWLGVLVPVPWLPTVLAAAACAVLAGLRPGSGRVGLAVAVLLLGWSSPASVPQGPELDGRIALRGRTIALTAAGGRLVALEALAPVGEPWRPASGRVLVDFGEVQPGPGLDVLAWGRALAPRPVALPGAPDPWAVAALAGARARLVVARWQPTGPAPPASPTIPPCRHQGLLAALAVGDRSAVPEATTALLRATGTSHLLAISGLHLGLVAGLVGWLGGWLARLLGLARPRARTAWLGALCAVAGACAYGQLAGWPVSAVRAALMLAGVGLALALGRGRDPRQLLGFAAFATVLVEPATVATPSWQLSFGALLGLILLTPRLARAIPPDLAAPTERMLQGAAATVGATVGTLPAAAWWFQQLALTAVPANLVALPLVGVVATPAALLAAALDGAPAQLATALGCAALDLTLGWLGLMQGPSLHPAVGPVGAVLLVGLPLLARRPVLASFAALVALGLRLRPAAGLVMSFLAVGQGSSVLVEWPDGRRWLVDGGPSPHAVVQHLRRRGVRSLDVVVVTHPHPDHIGGLQRVAAELDLGALWVPRPPGPGEAAYAALVGRARADGVPILGPDHPAVPALHPLAGWRSPKGSVNDESLVLLLAHGRHSALLTGDIEAGAEALLTPGLGRVDVLGVPHHGSRSSSTEAFVQALDPRIAVISCGLDNRFGHPHPSVAARYRDSLLLRTDQHGTVELRSDGLSLALRSWLPGRGWRRWVIPGGDLYPLSTSSVGSSSPTSSAASSALSSASSVSSRNR